MTAPNDTLTAWTQREAELRAKLTHKEPPRGKGDAFIDFLLALL